MLIRNISIILITGALATGCATDYGPKETAGTLIGAAGGALIGSQFGGGTGQIVGAAIGTAAGAFAGNYVGKSMDRQDRRDTVRYRDYEEPYPY